MIPTEMKHSVFITLPKKAKAMICTDFRTISLMSHVTTLLLKIIQRMANKIDKEVSRLQNGFRPGTGTREGIFNVRTICPKSGTVSDYSTLVTFSLAPPPPPLKKRFILFPRHF